MPSAGNRTKRSSERGLIPTLEAAPRVSLGEVVAARLREAILQDELRPGQHLREEEISELLQVSRGPVRDAFILLEREGLVRLSRHRGASVVELSEVDLGEVYSLRSAIEDLAVRLAIRRGQDDDIQAMETSLAELRGRLRRKLSEQEAARLDVEFHDAIFRAAHHTRLYTAWSTIRMQVYLFLCYRNIASADWREATVKGHAEIVELIRKGQEQAAATAVREHISAAYTRITDSFSARAGDQSPSEDSRSVAESFLLT